jgi:hypothetical protein
MHCLCGGGGGGGRVVDPDEKMGQDVVVVYSLLINIQRLF